MATLRSELLLHALVSMGRHDGVRNSYLAKDSPAIALCDTQPVNSDVAAAAAAAAKAARKAAKGGTKRRRDEQADDHGAAAHAPSSSKSSSKKRRIEASPAEASSASAPAAGARHDAAQDGGAEESAEQAAPTKPKRSGGQAGTSAGTRPVQKQRSIEHYTRKRSREEEDETDARVQRETDRELEVFENLRKRSRRLEDAPSTST